MRYKHQVDCTVLTPVLNGMPFIRECVNSVQNQLNCSIQHLFIDGGSEDGTLEFLLNNLRSCDRLIQQRGSGYYNALNIARPHIMGRTVSILGSDDVFASDTIVSTMIESLSEEHQLVYGDLIIIDRKDGRILRRWKSGAFSSTKLKFGWAPPHPAVFYSTELYTKIGIYDESLKISGDYEHLLRIFSFLPRDQIKAINMNVVVMRNGGMSTSLKNWFLIFREDWGVARRYFRFPLLVIFLKKLQKLFQISFIKKQSC